MTEIPNLPASIIPRFSYEVQLSWVLKNNSLVNEQAFDINAPLDNPLQFEEKDNGQPMHLFLHTIISCFMTTYLFFAKKMKFKILHFECNAVANMESMEDEKTINHVNLYPKIFIADESLREKAIRAVEKTRKYCLVSNAEDVRLDCHCKILTEKFPVVEMSESIIFNPSHSLGYAEEIGDKIGIDFKKIDLHEFRKGLDVEMEHGKVNPQTNVTDNNIELTAKIAWAHLLEIPDYYTRLIKMEKEAKDKLNKTANHPDH